MYEVLKVLVCLTGFSWTVDRHVLLKSFFFSINTKIGHFT